MYLGGRDITRDEEDQGEKGSEHERAARTAERLNGALAGAQLADQLKQAWLLAGRPPMAEVGDVVGYSKATISKVLSGKMPPAWRLVRKLGGALGVPVTTVSQLWHPLWIAADNYRRAIPYAGPLPDGQACQWCGAWVVNTDLHTAWHAEARGPVAEDGPLQWASLRDALPRREKHRS